MDSGKEQYQEREVKSQVFSMTQRYPAQWYALYTKSRHEKFVEAQLLEKGIEAFTPKITLKKRWSDRIKIIQEPLFKSYCFARFSLSEKIKAVSQAGVVKAVHFNGQYILVPETVINSLKILTESKILLDPCPYIKVNDPIVINKGPLKGLEGIVIEKRNKGARLVVSVDAIAASVQCTIDSDYAELA